LNIASFRQTARPAAALILCSSLVALPARGQEAPPAAPAETPGPVNEGVPPPPRPGPIAEPVRKEEEGFPWQKAGSVAIVGGIYGTAWAWVSAAWWTRKNEADGFTFMNEGAFDLDTYAGGSDKLGHYYAAYLMNRGFAGILEWGGFPRTGSIVTATALTTAFLTAVEYKDAYHKNYGWSWGDIVANSSGQGVALALMLLPWLDEAVSTKIMYFPSSDFFHAISTEGPLNTPEDYSGQTYLLSYHLVSLPCVKTKKELSALRYVDISLGYGTRGYKPVPDPIEPVRQELSLGFSVNFQRVFDELLWPRHGMPNTGVQVVHFVNEVYQVPYTRVPVVTLQRSGPATEKGR
jgi:hypothetical protein